MSTSSRPIACSLTGGNYRNRLTTNAALMRDGLRRHSRTDLTLRLEFVPGVADRVREMVRLEQECCGFLVFKVDESARSIAVTITAPEAARGVADDLFAQFVSSVGGAAQKSGSTRSGLVSRAAMITAAGAVACGACCVLPLAIPAVTVAGFGGVLAWFAGTQRWVAFLSLASAIFALALLWPAVERFIVTALRR